jgi:hypothetical protein
MHGIKFRFMFMLLILSTFKTDGRGACIVTLLYKVTTGVNLVIAHFVSLPLPVYILWIMSQYSWICVILFMSKKLHLICSQKTRTLMCPTWMMVS